MSARLDPAYRATALRTLAETEVDVLVIGGGVVGAGVALDAASRGLTVALVEARDWAAGTSSRSSKLIHGGLRYLEQRDFALVREALKERGLLLHRLAPHLVRAVPFLYPLSHRGWERAYVGTGVLLYDTIGGARAMPRHKHLSRRQALRLSPSLKPEVVTGAIRYYDAQVDDARYTMMITRTAAQHGATVLTRARVTDLVRDDAGGAGSAGVVGTNGAGAGVAGGCVVGARVTDLESGDELIVRARRVISATGVWTDETHHLAGTPAPFRVRTSKGVHLLVPRERIQLATGLITRTEKSVLLVMPWGAHWIIGTTDTAWELDKADPAVSRADVEYLLEHVNTVLRDPLTADDVVGVYAGLRPLLAGESKETAQLSREHAVAEPAPGFFVTAGGKFTTYRVMAADAVDAAVRGLGRAVAPSLTERLPITGAVGYHEMWADRHGIARRTGLSVGSVEHLLGRYGSGATDLLTMIKRDPWLAEPVPGATAYLKAEVVYAVTHEGALHLDDVLTRRTRISIEAPDRGVAAAVAVAGLIAPHLGWDASVVDAEVEGYREQVYAERLAQETNDDAAANAARLGSVPGAVDARPVTR